MDARSYLSHPRRTVPGSDPIPSGSRAGTRASSVRARRDVIAGLPGPEYAYLLGMYLGDGTLTPCPRGVFRLRIALDRKYTHIVEECRSAMGAVLPNRVGLAGQEGCIVVCSYSKHWQCLFPQHGPGRKHDRAITLRPWQLRIALNDNPEALLRGLVHSDGCRVSNVVKGHAYPRYHFTNNSDDIRGIFVAACRRRGIDCRHNNWKTVSVARRGSVARLDEFIGRITELSHSDGGPSAW